MLPVATPPNAVAYGTGYINIREMVKTGWALNLIGVFLITFFMFTLIPWALGFDPFSLPGWAVTP
jgi:sodium-dependent dicarboxylate transporter 2/3/5